MAKRVKNEILCENTQVHIQALLKIDKGTTKEWFETKKNFFGDVFSRIRYFSKLRNRELKIVTSQFRVDFWASGPKNSDSSMIFTPIIIVD